MEKTNLINTNEISTGNEWVQELYNFICKAKDENKLIKHKWYTYLVFTPDELVKEILKGRYRWGVPNWELINNSENKPLLHH